jgi:hypothetical protein
MRLNGRLKKLEAHCGAGPAGPRGHTRLLKGATAEAVLDAVGEAIDPADEDVATSILAHVDEAARTPREAPPRGSEFWYEGCEQEFQTHFFVYWLWGLAEGSWALPAPMPRAVLEGFNSRCGCVLWRCEGCLTGLGNGGRYPLCPVCGSTNLSSKKLSGPPWDAHWQYTPLPPARRWGGGPPRT